MNWLISVFSPLILNGNVLDKPYQNNWNPPLLRVDLKMLVIPHQLHQFTHHLEFLYFWDRTWGWILGESNLNLNLGGSQLFISQNEDHLYTANYFLNYNLRLCPLIFHITRLWKTKRNCNLKFSSFSFLISIYLYPPLHTKSKEIH